MTCHNYIFFTIDKAFYDVLKNKQESYKTEFLKKIQKQQNIITYSFTTLGLKQQNIFMLWMQSDAIETIQEFLNELLHTKLGKYVHISHTLLGMTRATQYSRGSTNHEDTLRKGGKYLIIYPFTKTKEWYMLNFQERRDLMKGHIAIGRKYPQISQILLYSYGIDDNEFIVSYETNNLSEFQELIIELRSDPVRMYTLKDTPIFTCLYTELEETLTFI